MKRTIIDYVTKTKNGKAVVSYYCYNNRHWVTQLRTSPTGEQIGEAEINFSREDCRLWHLHVASMNGGALNLLEVWKRVKRELS